jgi:hypothetical protein
LLAATPQLQVNSSSVRTRVRSSSATCMHMRIHSSCTSQERGQRRRGLQGLAVRCLSSVEAMPGARHQPSARPPQMPMPHARAPYPLVHDWT